MYTVTYDSSSHTQVLFQRLGSVWPKVFPYCIFNVALMAAIHLLHNFGGVSLAISNTGHTFMSLILAFLIVTRVNISVGRYSEARSNLEIMYRESRELIQNCCVFSDHITDIKGKEWRSDVAYRCMLLLRTAMAVVDYPTTKTPAWDVPELSDKERERLKSSLFYEVSDRPRNALRWAHSIRTEEEENMRVPVKMAYKLRSVIHSQSTLFDSKKIETNPELKLLGSVDSFMGGYYGIRKFMTTPFPFPLVQMTRTFLFLYVFTVPFALLTDSSNIFVHCIVVFILTFGFMGLETVSIELDDPFGDDDNDFDNLGMAFTAFEDNYLIINAIDGPEYADKLRAKMFDKRASDISHSEQTWLLASSNVV